MNQSHPLNQAVWRKSGWSGDGNCVEVATAETVVGVRDSKESEGPVLTFSPTAWSDFLHGVKSGGFNCQ